jgi:SAM-dependent methyltransferase
MPLALVACGALAVVVLRTYPDPPWIRDLLPAPQFLCGVVTLLVGGYTAYAWRSRLVEAAHMAASWIRKTWQPGDEFDQAVLLCVLALGAALALAILRGDPKLRWVRRGAEWGAFGTELAALILAGYMGYGMREATSGYRLMTRNFYGGLKVRDSGPATELDATRTLTHGTINHGEQYLDPVRRDLATTYYGPNTGVGIAIRDKQKTGRAIRVGVIGLGTGTLASYGRLGDYYRFYEINPLVLRMSKPPAGQAPQFTFLADCKAKLDVAMGDARLSLERERPENFDVLAVDAFSSDSIPVHLLTEEAMQLFFRHLRPDGILAVHISNRYLDLEPVVGTESQVLGKAARTVDTDEDESQDVFSATWVLVTSPAPGFDDMVVNASKGVAMTRRTRLWTDDYSNLFQILK